MSDNMMKAIEYRDLLREIKELELEIFGETGGQKEKAAPEAPKETQQDHVQSPAEDTKPEKGGKRVKLDRGKIFALKKAGWKNKDIALEMGCTEVTIASIIRTEGPTDE